MVVRSPTENSKKRADKRMSLRAAVCTFVADGCSLAFSGMGGAQCVAQTYEIIRQGIQDLTLIGDSPCESGDMLIGVGAVRKAEIAWCSYAVAGLGMNFRRAVEEGIPRPLVLEEYSNYTVGLRLLAGALNIPYMPTKSLLGSDLVEYNESIRLATDPFSGEKVALVPAARPDVAIVHVTRADRHGNGQMLGFSSNAENLVRAATTTILTCEDIVDTQMIKDNPNLTIVPGYAVDAVVEVPFACHPWNMPYAYAYDLPFHVEQLDAFRTRAGFERWIDNYCTSLASWDDYLDKVGRERLLKLQNAEHRFCGTG